MNLLLTSVGRRTYIVDYFKEAIGKAGEIHASNSNITLAIQRADAYLITPLIYDDSYIPVLLDYCKENAIDAILSFFDIDLLVLARNEHLFAEIGTKVLHAKEESLTICNDKWETYKFLKKNSFNTPETYLSLPTVLKALDTNRIFFPIILKPRWGMGSRGIYTVNNTEELKILYKKCQKEIADSYLKYETSFTPEFPVIFQEKLVGQEYGLDIINDLSGKYVTTLAKKKLMMRAGETDLGESVSSDIFEEISKKLSSLLNHKVIASVDCFVSEGTITILEINCRISGHYPVSHLAGANLPKQIIRWLSGEKTDPELLKYRKDLLIVKDLLPMVLNESCKKEVF